MSIVEKGDIVILIDTDEIRHEQFIGTKWVVQVVLSNYPIAAMITRDDFQITTSVKNLAVVPPPGSTFEHGEMVKVEKSYIKINHRNCNKTLVGKFGQIKNYDSKIDYYFIKSSDGESGWFPASSLIPLNFKGKSFFYPMQQVKFHGNITAISQVKRTKFNFGQLLLIDGQWVPSTEVEPIK